LLQLLGDILGSEAQAAATGLMRLRLMQPGFLWQSLIDLASGQDVLPPLIRALTVRGLLLPLPRSAGIDDHGHVTARLETIYRQHLARRQAERGQVERVLSALNGAGIVPLILKGARYLMVPVSWWSEARAMRDIDILVRPADSARAIAVLKAAGYHDDCGEAANSHHLPAMSCTGEPVALEVHTQALTDAGQKVMSTQHVWEHAAPAGAGSFLVMPTRWHALYCLLHHQISDHGHARRILAVKALWEWTMLARDFSPDDWKAITAHMQATGASEVLGSWLIQARRLFGAEIPSFVAISPAAHARADATFRLAFSPYWLRRAKFIADQLRFSFARESLAMRAGVPPSQVSLMDGAKHAGRLLRLHRGRALRRLIGRSDRMS
jgi:hypothetical protein